MRVVQVRHQLPGQYSFAALGSGAQSSHSWEAQGQSVCLCPHMGRHGSGIQTMSLILLGTWGLDPGEFAKLEISEVQAQGVLGTLNSSPCLQPPGGGGVEVGIL